MPVTAAPGVAAAAPAVPSAARPAGPPAPSVPRAGDPVDLVSLSPAAQMRQAQDAPAVAMRQLGALLQEFEQISGLSRGAAPQVLGSLAGEIGTAARDLGAGVLALLPTPDAPSPLQLGAAAALRVLATLAPAGTAPPDARSGDAQAGDAQAGDAQAGSAQAGGANAQDAQAGGSRAGTARAGDAEVLDAQARDGKAGDAQGRYAQARGAGAGDAQAGDAGARGTSGGDASAGDASAGDVGARDGSAADAHLGDVHVPDAHPAGARARDAQPPGAAAAFVGPARAGLPRAAAAPGRGPDPTPARAPGRPPAPGLDPAPDPMRPLRDAAVAVLRDAAATLGRMQLRLRALPAAADARTAATPDLAWCEGQIAAALGAVALASRGLADAPPAGWAGIAAAFGHAGTGATGRAMGLRTRVGLIVCGVVALCAAQALDLGAARALTAAALGIAGAAWAWRRASWRRVRVELR